MKIEKGIVMLDPACQQTAVFLHLSKFNGLVSCADRGGTIELCPEANEATLNVWTAAL